MLTVCESIEDATDLGPITPATPQKAHPGFRKPTLRYRERPHDKMPKCQNQVVELDQ